MMTLVVTSLLITFMLMLLLLGSFDRLYDDAIVVTLLLILFMVLLLLLGSFDCLYPGTRWLVQPHSPDRRYVQSPRDSLPLQEQAVSRPEGPVTWLSCLWFQLLIPFLFSVTRFILHVRLLMRFCVQRLPWPS